MTGRDFRRIALISLVALACSDAVTGRDPVDVIEDSALSAVVISGTPTPGAVLQVRFRNTGTERYWFGSCARGVERRAGAGWVGLPEELRVCTAEVYDLAPGGEIIRPVDIPADASAGGHRFVFRMIPDHPSARNVTLYSTSFEVR